MSLIIYIAYLKSSLSIRNYKNFIFVSVSTLKLYVALYLRDASYK